MYIHIVTLCRIYPLEHFQRRYAVEEVRYTDEASYISMMSL